MHEPSRSVPPRPAANARRVWWSVAAAAVLALASPAARAQVTQVFVDDSVLARDTLTRAPELVAAGNVAEAVRVLSLLLDTEGERVVAVEGEPNVFVSVRARVHGALLGDPALLEAFRRDLAPVAARLMSEGRYREAERRVLLTTPGLEAALRVAQEELEAARFETALLVLRGLTAHPDRVRDRAAASRAAGLATSLTRYLRTPEALDLAARWRADAGEAGAAPAAVEPPALALVAERSSRSGFAPLDEQAPPARALAEVPFAAAATDAGSAVRVSTAVPASWVSPSIIGETLYTNDGAEIAAWDRATLVPIWSSRPGAGLAGLRTFDEGLRLPVGQAARQFEELASVSVKGGVLVAVGGYALPNFRREGDTRVHALDAATGRVLWSVDPSTLARALEGATVRGPALLTEDTCVLALARVSNAQRIAASMMVGLDLATGRLLWSRTLCSVGIPPYPRPHRPSDIGVAEGGVIYRTDVNGVVSAIEARSGRVVWIRRAIAIDSGFGPRMEPAPWLGSAPIIDGESVVVLEPAGGDLVRLGRRDGAILERRAADELGAPRYIVRVGRTIAAVGTSIVNFVPLADFSGATVRLSPSLRDAGVSGRAVASGDRLLVPIGTGVLSIDPENPDDTRALALERTGNLAVGEGALVVADTGMLSSFLSWEAAEPRLLSRIARRPEDTDAALTYIEIAIRAGRREGIPGVADRVLDAADLDPFSTTARAARQRLFELLLRAVDPAGAEPAPDAGSLDQVLARASRAADTPQERARFWVTAAHARALLGQHARAVEAYQVVLADAELSVASVVPPHEAPAARGPDVRLRVSAGPYARERLTTLILAVGYAPYEPYSAQAEAELRSLGPSPGPDELESLASRFPLARSTPGVLLAAARAYAAPGAEAPRIKALARALDASRTLARITRQPEADETMQASGLLIESLASSGRLGEADRLIRRLAAESPGLAPKVGATPLNVGSLRADLEGRLSSRQTPPVVGLAVVGRPDVIAGWTPAPARFTEWAASDQVPMFARLAPEVAVFARRTEDGRLAPLWVRRFESDAQRPTVLSVRWDATYLLWPTEMGPRLERIDAATGATSWTSQEFARLLPPEGRADPSRAVRIQTPLDGDVSPDQVVVVMDRGTAVLLSRRGRGVGIDLSTGKPLWARQLPFVGVYDAAIAAGRLVVAGISSDAEGVVAFEARSGRQVSTPRTDPSLGQGPPRWVRQAGGTVLVGLDTGIFAWDMAGERIAWHADTRPARRTSECWVAGDRFYVVNQEGLLFSGALSSGEFIPEPLRTNDRLAGARRRQSDQPTMIHPLPGGHAALFSERGLAVFNPAGEMIGADARGPDRGSRLYALTHDAALFIDQTPVSDSSSNRTVSLQWLELPGGRVAADESLVVYEAPHALAVIDGAVIVGAGPVTIVLDSPPDLTAPRR
ncbi:MAG: PQQ-binding-like beta-propeller repeat protein [Phycisphaeraceae bacterium]|nr:MAG: PQQ-binding-like beta-propeller repeat protein [Phycisphaeraceae bacterium]